MGNPGLLLSVPRRKFQKGIFLLIINETFCYSWLAVLFALHLLTRLDLTWLDLQVCLMSCWCFTLGGIFVGQPLLGRFTTIHIVVHQSPGALGRTLWLFPDSHKYFLSCLLWNLITGQCTTCDSLACLTLLERFCLGDVYIQRVLQVRWNLI